MTKKTVITKSKPKKGYSHGHDRKETSGHQVIKRMEKKLGMRYA